MAAVYPNLKAEMARFGIRTKDLAVFIGCSPHSLTNKINGKTDFTLSESEKIHAHYFPNVKKDYLFERQIKDRQGA